MNKHESRHKQVMAAATVVVTGLIATGGCDVSYDEFRTVALPSVEAGIQQIADGVIEGAFAGFTPDEVDNNSGADDGSNNSTSG